MASVLSGLLLLSFAMGMVTGLGIKTPFDYSVFSAAAAAFLLAFWEPDRFTLDKLLNRSRNNTNFDSLKPTLENRKGEADSTSPLFVCECVSPIEPFPNIIGNSLIKLSFWDRKLLSGSTNGPQKPSHFWSERNLLIPNKSVSNREFAKPLYVAKRARWVWIQSVRHVRLAHLGAHSFPRMRLTSRLPCRIRIMCIASSSST